MSSLVTHYAVTRSPQVTERNADRQADIRHATGVPDGNDFDSDNDTGEEEDNDLSGDADGTVGVSMSRAQTTMKLPSTPAATKIQAMQASESYFDPDTDDQGQLFDEPLQGVLSLEASTLTATQYSDEAQSSITPGTEHQTSSPSRTQVAVRSQQRPEKRSSIVTSILGAASSNNRPRSSSGSSIVENLRKRLPNLISLPRFSSLSQDTDKKILGPAAAGVQPGPRPSLAIKNEEIAADGSSLSNETLTHDKDSKESVVRSSEPRKPLLRRATSDQSLYLRTAATGSSTFDDYTVFSDRSEMVNSRFKAITDTFQDSFVKQKLLSVSENNNGRNIGRTYSDEARYNTKMNARSLRPSDMPQQDSKANPGRSNSSKHPILKEALAHMTGDLLIMGGYRGSVLKDALDGKQLWIPIKAGMNLRKADLEVGLEREDEMQMEKRVIAEGVLSHIGPIDICRRLLRKCKKCPNVRSGRLCLHDYGYDWRLSPDLLANRLIQFLEKLTCNGPNRKAGERGAWLISHSLGGLLTRHVINRRPDLIAGVVYAGTPQNCVNILGPLRNGDDVLFSSRILTAQTNFTLRTSYALLPQSGRCFINKDTGERYDLDFFDARTWEEYRLSPCIKQPLSYQNQEKRTGVIGSLSDFISLPSKHLPSLNSTESSRTVPGPVDEAKEKLESAAEAADPKRPLSPTMGDAASRQHKPSVATTSTIPLTVAKEYLERTLASVLKFKEELDHRPSLQASNAYPPAAILFAKNTPTVYGAFVTSREAIKYDNAFENLCFAAGDGVVLASAAQLPTGYKCVGRVESDRGHVGLLGDLEGVGKCLLAVMKARSRGVGEGAYKLVPQTVSDPSAPVELISPEKGNIAR